MKQPLQVPLPLLEELTTTCLAPRLPLTGVIPVICVLLTTLMLWSAPPPTLTAVTFRKFVPVIVTAVPPAGGPLPGATLVTVTGDGGGGATLSFPEHDVTTSKPQSAERT